MTASTHRPQLQKPPAETRVPMTLFSEWAAAYVRAEPGGKLAVTGHSKRDSAALFELVDNEDGSWKFESVVAGVRVTACVEGSDHSIMLRSNMTGAEQCSKWRLQGISNGPYAFQSWLTKRWMVAQSSGALTVTAESFMLGPVGNERNVLNRSSHFVIHEIR